jgi:uncharacterized glyoxalase superfamily protein PhnB
MNITGLTPMLQVDNIHGTIDYYKNILGFTCVNYDPSWGWAVVIKDNIDIMFALPNKHMPYQKSNFTGSFYFKTTAVDRWWDLLKDKAEIFYGIENFEYGMREFAIRDCNGYILQFGQENSQEY